MTEAENDEYMILRDKISSALLGSESALCIRALGSLLSVYVYIQQGGNVNGGPAYEGWTKEINTAVRQITAATEIGAWWASSSGEERVRRIEELDRQIEASQVTQ